MDAESISAALKETGLRAIVCAAVVGDRDFSSPDAEKVAATERYLKACIRYAVTWGSPLVVGPLYAPVGKLRLPTEEARRAEWVRSVENLRRMAEFAGDAGVRLGIEPLNRFESDMVNTADDALRMLGEIDHPAIGLSLDSFHMNIEEVDFCKAVESAGKRLLHVQVSDSHRGVPGEGNSDWRGAARRVASDRLRRRHFDRELFAR